MPRVARLKAVDKESQSPDGRSSERSGNGVTQCPLLKIFPLYPYWFMHRWRMG